MEKNTEEITPQPENVTEQGKEQESAQVNEVEELRKQLETEKKETEKWQKESKAHQAQVTKKSLEIQRLQSQPRNQGSPDVLLDLIEEQYGKDPRITEIRNQKSREVQLARQEQIASEARSTLESKIVGKGLDIHDEQFDTVWDAYDMAYSVDGKFDRAENRLDRILNKVKKPSEEVKSKEVDEVEIARKYLSSKGYLVADLGQPASKGGSFQDIEQRYIKGEISTDEYEESAKKHGKLL